MTQPIRLLLLIPHLGGGGAERVAAELASRLKREQFRICMGLITADAPGAEPPPEWITVHRFNVRRVRHAWLKLIRLIRTEQPDVILSGMAHLNFLILLLKPFLPRCTRILIRQNSTASTSARNALDRFLYRRLYPRADAVICQSQAMADDLVANFGIRPGKLQVLHNPIDIRRIRNTTSNVDRWSERTCPRILTVGRLSSEKGNDLLIRAMEIVKRHHPNVWFAILGLGPEEASLRLLTWKLGLNTAVIFAGHDDPTLYYPRATLYVQPSRHEGMPNALLEAAAAGLPIVATPCSAGVSELLRDAPGTWLAASVSPEALAQTISEALTSLGTTPRRFEHAFLAPFEASAAIAAYEALITRTANEGPQ